MRLKLCSMLKLPETVEMSDLDLITVYFGELTYSCSNHNVKSSFHGFMTHLLSIKTVLVNERRARS
jgi:hypothetical protein